MDAALNKGQSVSINNFSNGISVATSFGFLAFLNVTGPPNEIKSSYQHIALLLLRYR